MILTTRASFAGVGSGQTNRDAYHASAVEG